MIKKMCCNFDDGYCILLDDGEPCVCPQLITFSHIICKYFKRSVLPIDKELCIELTKPKNSKNCSICGKEYLSKGNKSKYCDDCRNSKRQKETTNAAFISAFAKAEIKIKPLTLTLDNGSEFLAYKDLEQELGLKVYFADTHAPWQRGSNENING